MSFEIKIIQNTISPKLAQLIRDCSHPKSVLEAMGLALVALTQRAFRDASLRPLPWLEVKKAKGAPLYKSGHMKESIRVTEIGTDFVKVGTDVPYARYHQFGTKPYVILPSTKKALFRPGAGHPVGKVNHPGLPPRPFFPFDESGKMVPIALRNVEAAARKALRKLIKK